MLNSELNSDETYSSESIALINATLLQLKNLRALINNTFTKLSLPLNSQFSKEERLNFSSSSFQNNVFSVLQDQANKIQNIYSILNKNTQLIDAKMCESYSPNKMLNTNNNVSQSSSLKSDAYRIKFKSLKQVINTVLLNTNSSNQPDLNSTQSKIKIDLVLKDLNDNIVCCEVSSFNEEQKNLNFIGLYVQCQKVFRFCIEFSSNFSKSIQNKDSSLFEFDNQNFISRIGAYGQDEDQCCVGNIFNEEIMESDYKNKEIFDAQRYKFFMNKFMAWKSSQQKVFQRLTLFANFAKHHFFQTTDKKTISDSHKKFYFYKRLYHLLIQICSYKNLFKKSCSKCKKYLKFDLDSSTQLPPLIRSFDYDFQNQDDSKIFCYHTDCVQYQFIVLEKY